LDGVLTLGVSSDFVLASGVEEWSHLSTVRFAGGLGWPG